MDYGTFGILKFGPNILWPCWTGVWTVYWLLTFGVDVGYVMIARGPVYLTELTAWIYIVLLVTVLLDFSCAVHARRKHLCNVEGFSKNFPWYLQLLWVLFNVTNSVSLGTSILYFTLFESVQFSYPSINKHILNSVYVLLNLLVSAKPIRLPHVYQPIVFCLIFTIFTAVYQKTTGNTIYGVLDWDAKPGLTAAYSVGSATILVTVLHMLCFGIYKIRVYLGSKYYHPMSDKKQSKRIFAGIDNAAYTKTEMEFQGRNPQSLRLEAEYMSNNNPRTTAF